MTLQNFNSEIAKLESQIAPLKKRLAYLERQKQEAESLAFITANKIKLGDIQFSSATDLPWFGDCWQFARWIKDNSTKQWAEWNGRIYRTSDLILGRMPESPGIAEHIT